MRKSELRQLIREEYRRMLSERVSQEDVVGQFDDYVASLKFIADNYKKLKPEQLEKWAENSANRSNWEDWFEFADGTAGFIRTLMKQK